MAGSLEIKSVSTSISTQVSGGDGHLSAEVDSRSWGFNGGRTQYFTGDDCYVLVYKSVNVDYLKGFTSMTGVKLENAGISDAGYNIHREGLSFTTPVASSSKPLTNPTVIFDDYRDCGGAQYFKDTTIARLTSWDMKIKKPGEIPPYGFSFIEYTPTVQVWKFGPLKRVPELFSTTINGIIYGQAVPFEVSGGTALA